VILSLDEARDAYRVGLARYRAARDRGGTHRYGWEGPLSGDGIVDGQSAVAEALVAKALGREWLSSGLVPDRPENGDVSGGISVRWTPRLNGSLIIHEDEPDHLRAVLVVGAAPHQEIRGWISVAEGKQVGIWRTDVRFPAFFVPQRALHPIGRLV
jgi:hypothetical protein